MSSADVYKYSVPNCSKGKVKEKLAIWLVVCLYVLLLDEAPAKNFNQVDLNRKIVNRTELTMKLENRLFKSIFIKIYHFETKILKNAF